MSQFQQHYVAGGLSSSRSRLPKFCIEDHFTDIDANSETVRLRPAMKTDNYDAFIGALISAEKSKVMHAH